MRLKDIVEQLGLSILTSGAAYDTDVTGGYTCDLLSDVMANAKPGHIWITMQTHQNILAVTSIKDLAGLIIVNGRRPDEKTIQRADEENVTVMGTTESAFCISGRLYRLLEDA